MKEQKGAAVRRVAAWALCAVVASAAQAGEGVLLENIPANVSKADALEAAKGALRYREWKVVAEDADSVSATISRSTIDAKIRISVKGKALVYDESASGGPWKVDYTGTRVPTVTATPSRWLDYLRGDTYDRAMARSVTAAGLVGKPEAAARPDASAPAPAPTGAAAPRNSVQRLAELKEMLDRGLITADEYARKKDEILKAL